MHISFEGKTAVVTGGANGIGFAIARQLAESGARVVIMDLPKENPSAAASRIGGTGMEADVLDRGSLEAAFAAAAPFHVLCVNAGVVAFHRLIDTPVDAWNRVLAVNLAGAFHCVQIAARAWKEQRTAGAVVLTASTNSFDGEGDLVAYNASKSGLLGLLHTAAHEEGVSGLRG
jgi:NAD(P)-dependent dehydrogenase (short-subunit alcohol dehydrogenase family)